MAEVTAITAKQVLGVVSTSDGQHMLISFVDSNGMEQRLALDKSAVFQMLECIYSATSIAPLAKGLVKKEIYTLKPDWFEFSNKPSTGESVLTFYRGKGHISFKVSAGMATTIRENLAPGEAIVKPPKNKSRN